MQLPYLFAGNFLKYPVPVFIILFFASCKTTAPVRGYFNTMNKDTTISALVTPAFESKIRPGDNLGIVFKTINPEDNARYNIPNVPSATGALTPGYTVLSDGNIKVSRIGSVPAAGLTRKELAQKLETLMAPYLKDPIVEVVFLNHKVTVIGSVSRPQVITMPQEQISILDALVTSGDLLPSAKPDDIMIIRESNDQKIIKHINLNDHSILSSPWYYLQPNDVVYVTTDQTKVEKEEKRRRVQTTLSLVASGASLLVIIIDRLLR